MMHVVLIEPEIPWNTGNVGRTCLGAGAELHLVGRLGFHLDAKQVQRAGLDYWEKVVVHRHDSWETFVQSLPADAALFFFSTKGTKDYWDIAFPSEAYLIFGKETAGFPKSFYETYKEKLYRIPQKDESIRSLNLSTSAGIVLFEALRQITFKSRGS
ncbi:MAG TPA: tRNA (cytidine(34)-2'-O)-methyltransferase [bacterium]|jgi:tRNA (cytidine/uridine-2'-O-)-methyltransferase|nr:tRNA (cytidine(34)-2'-O)-methyltransferase [bacterium]